MIFENSARPILFFDGICNLCNGAVRFIIKHDKKAKFLFASLQSSIGEEAKSYIKKQTGTLPDSLILFYGNKYYVKADAVLQAANLLGGIWKLAAISRILPRSVRNDIYDIVARNRYKWFGRKEACMIPTTKLKSRFLS